MMHAAPSSGGQHIIVVRGSATILAASTSSAVTTWSERRWAKGHAAPKFQFFAAIVAKCSGVVPRSCMRRCAHSAK
jgi:hypothetical protein